MGSMDRNVKPKTLVESLDHGIPQVYPGVYVAVIILLTYYITALLHEIETLLFGKAAVKLP